MTANDIYCAALGFLFENPDEDADFHDHFLSLLNCLLQEALPYENAWRRAHQQPELAAAPQIRAFEDAVCYADPICRIALPFGIASYFYQDELDNFKAQDFRGRFINALAEAAPWQETAITDAYGCGEENL